MEGRVLITGASGFIGYHLVKACAEAGLEVYAAIRPTSKISHLDEFGVKYIMPRFNDVDDIRMNLKSGDFNYIIHAAGTTRSKTEIEYYNINAVYTKNLAVAAATSGIPLKKFVFISSLAALGPTNYRDPNPISELRTPNPITSYGKSKLLAEQYLADIDIPLITLRPTAVYGPREKDIYIMFKTLKNRLEPYIGKGLQTLSFIHAQDIATATIKSMASQIQGVAYNLSDGRQYNRYELADIVKKALGVKTLCIHIPLSVARFIAIMLERIYALSNNSPTINKEKIQELTAENWSCSIESISRDLGFEPQFDLKSGLADTIKWYKSNNWL